MDNYNEKKYNLRKRLDNLLDEFNGPQVGTPEHLALQKEYLLVLTEFFHLDFVRYCTFDKVSEEGDK